MLLIIVGAEFSNILLHTSNFVRGVEVLVLYAVKLLKIIIQSSEIRFILCNLSETHKLFNLNFIKGLKGMYLNPSIILICAIDNPISDYN